MQLRSCKIPFKSTADADGPAALRHGWRRAAAFSGTALALLAAPVALASGGDKRASSAILGDNTPLKGAIHNPASSSFFRTTGIFANFSSWTLRVKNAGSGGAGTFGCKASSSGSACLEAENTNGGLAFEFATTGSTGGKIQLPSSSDSPFTTNAHGEASGLNANYLQGKQASEFQLVSKPAANSEALGGVPASEYAKTGQLLFADVSATGTIQNTRGATAASASANSFTVTFGTTNVSKCSFTASPQGAALTTGALGVEASTGNTSAVVVNAPAGFTGGVDLQVLC
jgi:hypothetical protein